MFSLNSMSFDGDAESEPIRLRTLMNLRWIAIAGQLAAMAVAAERFGVVIHSGLSLAAIGASVIANVVSATVYPPNARLTRDGATAALLFDIAQLGVLLYLTGGLTNPFAFLILAPVTICASVLTLRRTILLGCCAIIIVTVLVFFHRPLVTTTGQMLELPALFAFGFWLAIVIGIVFLGVYAYRVAREARAMRAALLATQMALAREQKLTDLGGVVAAAAHELGTPLATIKLVSAELIDDLADRPQQQEDAKLIRAQAERCRDILHAMGRSGKEDLHMRQVPFAALLREAADPHMARGKEIVFSTAGDLGSMPVVLRQPEILHGMRNLIQNAVDFAATKVLVEASWTNTRIRVRVLDDGTGFPPQLIGRIGDPFVRSRQPPRQATPEADPRPGYKGMGLGLFIAKTLLERTGAELGFANGAGSTGGAIVEVIWSRDEIEAPSAGALGENPPLGE